MAKTDNSEILRQTEHAFPFIKNFSDSEKQTFIANVQTRQFNKGEYVHTGDGKCTGVIAVNRGRLRTYILSPEGKEVTLFRLLSADVCILTASCMMKNIAFDVHVQAEEDCSLLVINPEYFEELALAKPEVEKFKNDIIAMRFSEVMWLIEQIMFMKMDQRIANFLIEMENILGKSEIDMSHQEIADNLGTAREVVSRILKYFENEGIVSISRKVIKILDPKKLAEISS